MAPNDVPCSSVKAMTEQSKEHANSTPPKSNNQPSAKSKRRKKRVTDSNFETNTADEPQDSSITVSILGDDTGMIQNTLRAKGTQFILSQLTP